MVFRRSKEEIIDMLNNDHDIFIGELIDKNGSQGKNNCNTIGKN